MSLQQFLGVIVTVLAIVASVAAGARWTVAAVRSVETKGHAESTFVRRDSLEKWRQRDSLNLRNALDRLGGNIDMLVRACQNEKKCP